MEPQKPPAAPPGADPTGPASGPAPPAQAQATAAPARASAAAQAPPVGTVNPNPTPGFPASATLPPGQPVTAPVVQTAAATKAAEEAAARRQAQAEHDARAAEQGVVAGKGGGTVEVEAPKDSNNRDGKRTHRLFVSPDGVTTYAAGPGQTAVAHDPDPATQMFGAPEDRDEDIGPQSAPEEHTEEVKEPG